MSLFRKNKARGWEDKPCIFCEEISKAGFVFRFQDAKVHIQCLIAEVLLLKKNMAEREL